MCLSTSTRGSRSARRRSLARTMTRRCRWWPHLVEVGDELIELTLLRQPARAYQDRAHPGAHSPPVSPERGRVPRRTRWLAVAGGAWDIETPRPPCPIAHTPCLSRTKKWRTISTSGWPARRELGAVTAPRQYWHVIVLHAAWLTGSRRLALWAEDGNRPRSTPARRGRRASQLQPHPFALDPDGLRLAVAEMAGVAAADLLGEGHVQLTLQLPDAGGSPIGSSLDDEPQARAPAGAHPPSSAEEHPSLWTAPGFVLGPSAAAKFLWTLTSSPGSDQSGADAGRLGRRSRARYPLRCSRGRNGGGAPGPGSGAARSRVRRRPLAGVLAPARRRA